MGTAWPSSQVLTGAGPITSYRKLDLSPPETTRIHPPSKEFKSLLQGSSECCQFCRYQVSTPLWQRGSGQRKVGECGKPLKKNQREIESKLQIFNTLFAASELFGIRSWLLRAVVGFESKFLKPPSQLNQWVIQVEVAFRKFSQPFCFIFFPPAGNITLRSQ